MITCSKCNLDKDPKEYYSDPKKVNGKRSSCKKCDWAARDKEKNRIRSRRWHKNMTPAQRANKAAYMIEWKRLNLDRIAGHQRKIKYGLSQQEYEDMLRVQGGKCAICLTEKPGGQGGFNVDHCHTTGKVRGLLCTTCNFGLGQFKDSTAYLKSAIIYLEKSI